MGGTISTSDTKLSALTLQSSCYGGVIPVAYGLCQLPVNLLWYGGFKANPTTTSTGGKGGVQQENTTYSYSADVILGVSSTRLNSVTQIWVGKSVYSGGQTGGQTATVTEPYAVQSSGAMTYALSHASAYSSFTGITQTISTQDGTSAVVPLSKGVDYTVDSSGTVTIVNNALRGKTVQVSYQYTTSTPATTALAALGFTLLKGDIGQSTWSGLSSYGTQAIGYSGIAAMAATQYNLGNTGQIANHKVEGVFQFAYSLGMSIPDADPSMVMSDLLSNARYGAQFPASKIDFSGAWSDYCVANNLLVSPAINTQQKAADYLAMACELTNSALVWSGGRLKVIPYGDATITGNGRTFTPNTTPVYDLDDTCWVDPGPMSPPVQYQLKTTSDRYNHVRVEYLDRTQQYNVAIAQARDLTDIRTTGLRDKDVVQAHWICKADIAQNVAQLIMQRSLYVLATYKFTLPWHFALLEPMDLVTLTDAELGLNKWPVRITSITEAENGDIQVEAEDYPSGVVSASLYPAQAPAGYQHNYNVDGGLCDPPIIFEVPYQKSKTGLGLYVATRGSTTVPNTNWGGCDVWISMDGSFYKKAGRMYGPSRMGKLSTNVAPTDTSIAVSGLGSSQLNNGSANDAAVLNTLCYIGGSQQEFFAYQTATLTGTGAYTLTGLNRGAFNSAALETHFTNDAFVRIDDAVIQSDDLDPSFVGKTVYVKLVPFNIYGAALYDISTITAYSYTINGNQYVRGTGKKLRAVARGNSDTAGPLANGLYDMTTGTPALIGSNGSRSYNVYKILRAAPYTVTSVGSYDVYGSPTNATTMATALNAIGNDYVVVVWTYDEPQTNRLSNGLDTAMYRCGASHAVFGSPNFKFRSAYCLVGIPGVGEGGGAEMYNGDTDASTNAWTDVVFNVGPDGFYVTGTTSTPRSLRDYSYTGDLNAAAATILLARGTCSVSGGTISCNASSPSWGTGDVYSQLAYTNGAFVSSAIGANAGIIFGLDSNPSSTPGYGSVQYGWYVDSSGNCVPIESGSYATSLGSFSLGDVLGVFYDGINVYYVKNGTVVYTHTNVPAGMTLYFHSVFGYTGTLQNVQFGPMSGVNGIGTSQLLDNAATNVYTATHVNGPVSYGGTP